MPFSLCYFGINLWVLKFSSFNGCDIHMSSSSPLLDSAPGPSISSPISSCLPFCLCHLSQVYRLYFGVKIVHHIEIFPFLPLNFQKYVYTTVSAIIFHCYSWGRGGLYYAYKPCFDGVCVLIVSKEMLTYDI